MSFSNDGPFNPKSPTRLVTAGLCNGTFKADLDRGFAALNAG
jgi:hypothetical protein